MTNRLAGRRILVTGAASGIGRATAELFRREGATLALLDRDRAALDALAASIGGVPLAVDLLEEQRIGEVVDQGARQLGGLDGVVNAAGIFSRARLARTDLAAWHREIGINLTGPFLVIQAALPWLQAADLATVVNVASLQGLMPRPFGPAYHASKGGLIMLSKEMAAELGPKIRVNVVCPGMVDTPLVADLRQGAGWEETASQNALKRAASADEIARTLLFLSSAESSYINGVALAVDGGRSFH